MPPWAVWAPQVQRRKVCCCRNVGEHSKVGWGDDDHSEAAYEDGHMVPCRRISTICSSKCGCGWRVSNCVHVVIIHCCRQRAQICDKDHCVLTPKDRWDLVIMGLWCHVMKKTRVSYPLGSLLYLCILFINVKLQVHIILYLQISPWRHQSWVFKFIAYYCSLSTCLALASPVPMGFKCYLLIVRMHRLDLSK